MSSSLRLLLFLGSTRPNRVCDRVATYMTGQLSDRGHNVTVIDPLKLDLPLLHQPNYAWKKDRPAALTELEKAVQEADGYVVVSPEYNHSVPPALSNTLAYVGGSSWAFKPSAIVTYSAGQWGGVRAAVALRPLLSELGCLPVSAITAFPFAQTIFKADGTLAEGEDEERWSSYCNRTLSQLEWVGEAFLKHKEVVDPTTMSPPNTDIKQRNPPA